MKTNLNLTTLRRIALVAATCFAVAACGKGGEEITGPGENPGENPGGETGIEMAFVFHGPTVSELTVTLDNGAQKTGAPDGENKFKMLVDESAVMVTCKAGFQDGGSTSVKLGRRPDSSAKQVELTFGQDKALDRTWNSDNTFIQINSLEELNAIRDDMHTKLKGRKYAQKGVLDFKGNDMNGDEPGNWSPIGIRRDTPPQVHEYFTGTFQGGAYPIHNLSISATENYQGLFGYAEGATISGVRLKSCSITIAFAGTDIYDVGGICGSATAGTSIDDCCFEGTISAIDPDLDPTPNSVGSNSPPGIYNLGGICGALAPKGNLSNCKNYGEITVVSNGQSYGGICGNGLGKESEPILNCENHGEINVTGNNAKGSMVGGICGQGYTEIRDCKNTAKIQTSGSWVGGICGLISNWVTACENSGAIISTRKDIEGYESPVGGICGVASAYLATSYTIKKCTNSGHIKGAGSCIGGIVGRLSLTAKPSTSTSIISYCVNTGKVEATSDGVNRLGGICGYSHDNGRVEGSSNSGEIVGNGSSIGGVVGENATGSGNIFECTNTGSVTANSPATGESNVGGVIGKLCYLGGRVVCTWNSGEVTGTGKHIGGICGYKDGTLSQCYNIGKVMSKTASNKAYAVAFSAGDTSLGIYSCYWTLAGDATTASNFATMTESYEFSNSHWPPTAPLPDGNYTYVWVTPNSVLHKTGWGINGGWNGGGVHIQYPVLWKDM